MKQVFIMLLLVPCMAFAEEPITSCPSGYIVINESDMTIATTCPAGTVSAGTAESCLVTNPAGSCIMYAPVGVPYTGEDGLYEFVEPCSML